jgi:hypothetical protein
VTHGQVADLTSNCLQNGGCTEPAELNIGWRILLECPPDYPATCGEKNLSTAFTLSGTIYFTTYIPAGSSTTTCSLKEGGGLLYAIKLQDATAALNLDASTAGKTKEDRITVLTSGGIPAEVVSLGDGKLLRPDLTILDTGAKAGFKSFWYRKK